MGEGEITEFSFAEVKLLINMALIEKPKVMTLSMLAEKINTKSSAPGFVKVTDFLKANNVLVVHPYLGNTKIVTIDDKKLTDIIDEQYITNFFYEYFKEYHIIAW